MKGPYSIVFLLFLVLAQAAVAQPQVQRNDDIRSELAALAERVGRLEDENAMLKQRNDALERRVEELRAPEASVRRSEPAPAPPRGPEPPVSPEPRPWYESVKVSGYLFGDAYAVLDQHDPDIEGQNGFWIRRGYLTFDARVAQDWSARLRFEVNSPGDFESNSKLEPFVKDAYLAWKHDSHEIDLGLSSTPTFEFIEGFWGYRSIEKTPLDLYRVGKSRDLGIAYKGQSPNGGIFYHAMLGNGAGDGSETNEGKKVMGALGFKPAHGLVAQLYVDYEDRPGATDRSTLQAFLGWAGERSRYGLQYAEQERGVDGAPDESVAVASAFGIWELTRRGSLLARYDRSFDGYPDADSIPYLRIANDTPFDLAILGWEQQLNERISLTPNFEYVRYRENRGEPALDDDLYGRLTLYYQF
ncbi:MAG TPA: hypothetical protein VLM41_05375 [Steroidobacteraceae bacterium]|nr:hypothetical protein [Steroidobacteraceae bacterium]